MDVRLLWLALGAFAGSVESSLIVAVLPAIAAETGITVGQAGYVVFAYSVAYGIGTPVLSTLLGGLDRRSVVAGAELVFGICAILFGLLPGFLLVLTARTLLAFGAGLFTSTAQSTAVALAAPGRRGRAISTVVMGGTIAVAFGAPSAALVAQLLGWRVAYVGLGLVAVAASTIMWLRLPGDLHGDRRSLAERVRVLGERGVPTALAGGGLMILAMFMVQIYISPITTEALHLDISMVPAVLFAFGLGAIAGNQFGGRLADRIGARRSVLVMVSLLIALLMTLPLLQSLPQPVVAPLFLGFSLFFGLLTWGSGTPQFMRVAQLAPTQVTLVASLNLTAGNIGGAIAALAGGAVLEGMGAASIGWCAVLVAVLALVVSYLVPDARPASPSD